MKDNVKHMENETPKNKVATSVRIDSEVNAVIADLAAEEDRPSMANMMERLLKTHPRVTERLSPETADASA